MILVPIELNVTDCIILPSIGFLDYRKMTCSYQALCDRQNLIVKGELSLSHGQVLDIKLILSNITWTEVMKEELEARL